MSIIGATEDYKIVSEHTPIRRAQQRCSLLTAGEQTAWKATQRQSGPHPDRPPSSQGLTHLSHSAIENKMFKREAGKAT
jgi:hypothetical protein